MQWVEEIQTVFDIDEKDIGIINSIQRTEGLLTVATVQSLVTLPEDELKKMSETYGHVICDECHEAAGNQFHVIARKGLIRVTSKNLTNWWIEVSIEKTIETKLKLIPGKED